MSKPYGFINDRLTTFFGLKNDLRLGGAAARKFDQLNPRLYNSVILPGHLVVIGDDSRAACTEEEAALMRAADDVSAQLVGSSHQGNALMLKNYDFLQSVLQYGSLGVGSVGGAWSKHLDEVKKTLEEIESAYLHYRKVLTDSARAEFFSKRRALFHKLEAQLQGLARYGTGLMKNDSIKKMLGVSTKSYLHSGEIKRYTEKLRRLTRMSGLMKTGTPIGIALDFQSTRLEIIEACSSGRESECTQAKYVELSKFLVGSKVALLGGAAGGSAAIFICAALTLPSAGTVPLACSIAGGAAGAFSGGLGGAELGEMIGNFLYRAFD